MIDPTLKPDGYRPRLLDAIVDRKLRGFGAVEVTGTKFCGKTWTSLAHGRSVTHVDDEAVRQMLEVQTTLALEGEHPHVIDEWQDVPHIWDAVRRDVDGSGNRKGRYILTGSSTVDRASVSHSGAGRIARIHMRPMSLQESGASSGEVSLAGLFEGRFAPSSVQTDIRDIARLVCRGGWPASLGQDEELALDLPAQYLDALFNVSAAGHGLNPRDARRVAVSLARSMGRTLTYKTLYEDAFLERLPPGTDVSVPRQRLLPYLSFFDSQYFIEDQAGWDAPVKSRSRVRSKPKRTFVDPSLPAALLAMTPERLMHKRQVLGELFEELCLRDVRIYASALAQTPDPEVFYYADADGLEVDIVVELADGRWGALEVKLSDGKIAQAVKNLVRLRDKVLANPLVQNRAPEFLAVLVGKAEFCRRTPEGVYVVPLTCFGA